MNRATPTTNAENRGALKRMNNTMCAAYRATSLNTKYQQNIIEIAVETGRLARRRSKGEIRCRLAE